MKLPQARFACLGDYVNSRGAADMGLLPGFLPGYVPVDPTRRLCRGIRRVALRQTPGLDLVEMFDAAERGDLAALYVVGTNPIARYGIDPAALKNTFLVVQDMFLTETALLADVVLPCFQSLREGRNRHQHLRRPATGEEGRRPRRCAQRLRVDCAPRRHHGRRRQKAGSLRPRRPCRHGPDPRSPIRRSRPSQRLAGGAKPGTEAQPL